MRIWQVYVIELDNRGRKSYGTPHELCHYVGMTGRGFHIRFGDYLKHRGNNGFISTRYRGARLTPKYVEYVAGYRKDVLKREKQIKRMPRKRREKLFTEDSNVLVGYKPNCHIVLKKYNHLDDQIVLKIK